MEKIGLRVPESGLAHNSDEAHVLLDKIGFLVYLDPISRWEDQRWYSI